MSSEQSAEWMLYSDGNIRSNRTCPGISTLVGCPCCADPKQRNWDESDRVQFETYRLDYVNRLRRIKTVTISDATNTRDETRENYGLSCVIGFTVCGLPATIILHQNYPDDPIIDRLAVGFTAWCTDPLARLERWQNDTPDEAGRFDLG